jgi:hypothetical protein
MLQALQQARIYGDSTFKAEFSYTSKFEEARAAFSACKLK